MLILLLSSGLIFQVCFSNEFSTFSHKLIYVDFQVGDEPQLPGVGDHFTAMTQVRLTYTYSYLYMIRMLYVFVQRRGFPDLSLHPFLLPFVIRREYVGSVFAALTSGM